MSRYWFTAERAIIALGLLAILTLFTFTRLVSNDDPDAIAAVLGSTELADGANLGTPSASGGTAEDAGPDRSSGAIPAPIGPTTIGSIEETAASDPPPETALVTTSPSTDVPVDEDAPAEDAPEGPDQTPDTTAPPAEPAPDEPTDDGLSDKEEESPNQIDVEQPNPDDPAQEPEQEVDEEPVEDLSNTAPTVWLTWPGYTLGGLTGQTTNPVTFAAGDPDGDPLTFSATGMPPGLTIDPMTGTITGTFTAPCTCQVTIIVSDGRGGVGTAGFGWTVV